MAGYRREDGFTLIEILIAMTLLGVMVVLLFSSLKIAADSWNAGETRIVDVNKKAVVYQFFKRHLSTIKPVVAPYNPETTTDPIGDILVFSGFPQYIRFVASLPLSSTRKGLQIFQINTDPQAATKLLVSLSPYQQTPSGEPEKVVLIDHVKSYNFAYFGKTDESPSGVWHPDWNNLGVLPQLIRVSIQLDDDSYWPEMVFPVKINGKITSSAAPTETNQQPLTQ